MARILSNLIAAVLLALAPAVLAQEPPAAGIAVVLDIDGAIGPATAEYVHAGLAEAARRNARVVVLRLDTPGGLVSSMREIIHESWPARPGHRLRGAERGARRQRRHLHPLRQPPRRHGAGHPSRRGDPDRARRRARRGRRQEGRQEGDADSRRRDSQSVNDAVAYIRSLAQLRGRNAEWAEKAVREAATAHRREALKAAASSKSSPATSPTCCSRPTAAASRSAAASQARDQAAEKSRRSSPTGASSCSRSSPIPTSPHPAARRHLRHHLRVLSPARCCPA